MRSDNLPVRNHRVPRDVTFEDLTPLTVLGGVNASGRSRVLAFLHPGGKAAFLRKWPERMKSHSHGLGQSHGPVSGAPDANQDDRHTSPRFCRFRNGVRLIAHPQENNAPAY